MNKVTFVKNKNYSTISNMFLRDKNLSLKAKGLLAMIFALPDDWDFSINFLLAIIKEGKTATYNAIDELKEFGYCSVVTLRNDKGVVIGNDYTFYENPYMDNQDVDNKPQINTNNSLPSTKDTNKIKKEENTNIFSKKNDYQAIVDCWNENNGKCLGNVTKLTPRRKQAIKKAMDDNGIEQETLMNLFKTLPHADSWLYNPNGQHKNWKPDFDWWMANTNGWLTKALEGKVHKENPQVFSMIMQGDDAPYSPYGNFSIGWDEPSNAYMYIGFYYDGYDIADGYNVDTRPNGAKLVLNNARGTIIWNSEIKKWVKQ